MAGGGRREELLENVRTTLVLLLTGVANGYNLNAKLVSRDVRPFEELNLSVDTPTLFIAGGPSAIDPDYEFNSEEHAFTVFILGLVQARTGRSTLLNKLLEDAKRRMLADRTRGGLAQDTKLVAIPEIEEVDLAPHDVAQFRLQFELVYSVAENEI